MLFRNLLSTLVFGSLASVSAGALADGKPKFLGGVHSSSQAVNFLNYWNQVTPENAGKWGSVEATRDVMNWASLDAAYALAKNNGLPFRFHILVWGNQQPAWIASLPPAEQLEEIEEWYAAVAARYPEIDYLEVVNEPISDAPDGLPARFDPPGSVDPNDGNYIAALGGTGTTGWDWVLQAFRLARAAFPDTPLVMHDYSIINNTTTLARFIEIVELLKAEGLVDIIGEQAHSFTIASMQASTLTANLNTLAAVGLPIMITEMDIDGADATTVNDAVQLDRYQRLFPAMWEHPAVMGITTWGYRTGLWRANAALVLADGTERSAMTWLRTYVAETNPPLRPTFTRSPRSLQRDAGQTAVFSATVLGNPAPTLQWQVSTDGGSSWTDIAEGGAYSGVTTNTLTIAAATAAMDGHRFRLTGSNTAGNGLSTYAATLDVSAPPAISVQPLAQATTAGQGLTLSAEATGPGTLTYQWQLDGVDIPGATGSTYALRRAQAFHAGSYRVVVSNEDGSATSQSVNVAVAPATTSDARLMNISTRGLSRLDSEVLIPGFVINGTGTKRVLVRAVGPALAEFGVAGTLADPTMTLLKLNTSVQPAAYEPVASNDDWSDAANAADIASAVDLVGAFALTPGSTDAALLVDLPAGQYSVVANGVNNTTGVAIVEVYDADPGSPSTRLVNISNRGFVGEGAEIMIPGFVVSPEGPRTFLIRVVGPTLAEFDLQGVLADPVLDLFERVPGVGDEPPTEVLILSNDDWDGIAGSATSASVGTEVGAYPLAAGSKDAAFVVTLPPGVYTVNARGKGGATGVALVEVYLVP
ncbi:hypothetical protein ASA1KI_15090 [Opitutales bacterium ASA1]|nr:hypothetical protein ASA1KI_15090 [Opitutales bacterium ASA1]